MSKNNKKKPPFPNEEERRVCQLSYRYYFISAKYLMVRTICEV